MESNVNPCGDAYSFELTPGWLAAERAAIGINAGANGYTTVRQAELLGDALKLGPGRALLDIGCGRGWPGAHIAERTGCDVVLMDVPRTALMGAVLRYAEREDVALVQGAGSPMPFAPRMFDAVSHADVLC
jgi:ubiquinone/menaquinone biosynthesis C-methylase UbiE